MGSTANQFQIPTRGMKKISFWLLLFLVTLAISSTGLADPGDSEILVGITSNGSRLVSFDPYAGAITEVHGQLNPYEGFTGMAHDPNHDKVYALSQVENNLYSIDPVTLNISHIGNLHIDRSASWGEDASALAYDPVTDTLYTAIEHWDVDYTNIWSELCEVDVSTGELTNVGDIYGPFISSLDFNEQDGQLYGLAVYGSGSWDSPHKSHVVRINPQDAEMDVLFETPYHTVLGFPKKPGGDTNIYYSWINWSSRFYGEVNIDTETVTPLGNADPVDVISAMTYKSFDVGHIPSPLEEIPVTFHLTGGITEVWDPDKLLNGAIGVGDSFYLHFTYDMNAPYKFPNPNLSAPYRVSVTINNMVFASDGIQAGVRNNYYDYMSDEVSDQFWISSVWGNTIFPIPMPYERIDLRLTDYSGTALSNNNVLPASFDFSPWDENIFLISAGNGEGYSIWGIVDNSGGGGDGSGAGGCFIATAGRGT